MIKRFLKQLFTSPLSPEGRKFRIEHLMKVTKWDRDVCAAIVYSRDKALGRTFSDSESTDAHRIAERFDKGEITLPRC